MNLVDKLRALGLSELASEASRRDHDLLAARRQLVIAHQINEEYRLENERLAREMPVERALPVEQREATFALIEKNARLARELGERASEVADLKMRMEQLTRSLNLSLKTTQEEASARASLEDKIARQSQLLDEAHLARQALNEKLAEQGQALETAHAALTEANTARDELGAQLAERSRLLEAVQTAADEEAGANNETAELERRLHEQESRAQAERLQAQAEISALREALAEELAERERLGEQIGALAERDDGQAQAHEHRIAELEAQLAQAQAQLRETQAAEPPQAVPLPQMQSQLLRLIKERDALKAANIEIRDAMEALRQGIASESEGNIDAPSPAVEKCVRESCAGEPPLQVQVTRLHGAIFEMSLVGDWERARRTLHAALSEDIVAANRIA